MPEEDENSSQRTEDYKQRLLSPSLKKLGGFTGSGSPKDARITPLDNIFKQSLSTKFRLIGGV